MSARNVLLTTLKYGGILILGVVLTVAVLIGWFTYKYSSTANEKPIRFLYPSFYLKVEDQHGDPVAEAGIGYTNGHNFWLGSDRSYAETSTDADGMTRFYLDGRQFGITELYKPGYHIDFRQQLDRVSEDPLKRLFPSLLKQYGKSSPLVIRAWKLTDAGEAFRGAGFLSLDDGEAAQFILTQNQNTSCLKNNEFFPCNRRLSTRDWPEEGRIVVRVDKVDGQTDHRESLGWSLHIDVPSGGIMEVDDLYLYEAPADGYQRQWSKSHSRETPEDYSSDFMGRTHKFYVRLGQGEYYGRLYVDVMPFYRDGSRLSLEYRVNAAGGRRLDPPMGRFNVDSTRRRFNYVYRDP